MRHVLVGTDGSAGAEDAVRWAARLAAAQGAELTVATGFVPVESELPPALVERRTAEAEAQLESWSAPARLPGLAVHTVVERGDPRVVLASVAERVGADLLVVGRVGSSAGPGPLHLSSVPEYLVHHADHPLAVVGGAVGETIDRVLVAVDGSANAHAALRWVADLAAGTQIAVDAVSVEAIPAITAQSRSGWRDELLSHLEGEWTEELADAGVVFEAHALSGTSIADVLVDTAQRRGADLVVAGMRGTGGFTGLRLGSVASRILHRADRPVVLIPLVG